MLFQFKNRDVCEQVRTIDFIHKKAPGLKSRPGVMISMTVG